MEPHVVTPIEKRRRGPSFVLGRVSYHTDAPERYEIKVIKRGHPKLLVGKKGIYVIDDEMAEELIREVWEKRLKERKKRRKSGLVEPPVEVSEENIRKYFSTKGIIPHLSVGWVNFYPELPNFSALRERVRKIIEKQRAKTPL